MNIQRDFYILEIFLIFFYILLTLFSIVLQPINLILGIICVLFLPGYNLLNLIKPHFNLIEKLGYALILSLALENILMFSMYLSVYNLVTYVKQPSFVGLIYNQVLLILLIQFINLIFILIRKIRFKEDDNNNIKKKNHSFSFENLKQNFNPKIPLIFIGFILSLTLLCISTQYSNVKKSNFYFNYNFIYKADLAFFIRVPFIFYIFLAFSIIFLTYIIFFIKNKYLVLTSISAFMYCIWILPYLQINDFFSFDSFYLCMMYDCYSVLGITNKGTYGFCILPQLGSQRYSTSLFNVIILKYATNISYIQVIWYLYPLIFITMPFFFYSIFQKYSKVNKKSRLNSIILTIFVMLMPQFIKSGHNTSTGMIGIIIFFMLIIEFFNLIHKNKLNVNDYGIIILLYIFLCLTHFEESIYFIIIVFFYSIYFFYLKFIDIKTNTHHKQSYNSLEKGSAPNSSQEIIYKELKRKFFTIGLLFYVLILIFFFINEFFGFVKHYFRMTFFEISFYELYQEFAIWIVIIVPILLILGNYMLIFKYSNIILIIQKKSKKLIKKIHNFIIKIISSKINQILFFVFSFCLIIIVEFSLFSLFYIEIFLQTLIILISGYFFSIFQIFLFFKGVKYYKINNVKQNFFLLSIIASASIMFFFLFVGFSSSLLRIFYGSFDQNWYYDLIVGHIWKSVYIFHTKFLIYLTFFNLIIIQNFYFKDLMLKKKKYLILMTIIFLSLGVFSSLRALAFG